MTDWAGQQNLTDTILPAQSVIFNLSYRCQNTQIIWFHFSFVYIDVVFALFVIKAYKKLGNICAGCLGINLLMKMRSTWGPIVSTGTFSLPSQLAKNLFISLSKRSPQICVKIGMLKNALSLDFVHLLLHALRNEGSPSALLRQLSQHRRLGHQRLHSENSLHVPEEKDERLNGKIKYLASHSLMVHSTPLPPGCEGTIPVM